MGKSIFELSALPEPPPLFVPDPEYARLKPIVDQIDAHLEAGDKAGFNAVVRAFGDDGVKALLVSETMNNPLYWDHKEVWETYKELVWRWRFRAAKALYLMHLHPHVGHAIDWVDPDSLRGLRRELTMDERVVLWNSLWAHLLDADAREGEGKEDDHLDETNGTDALPEVSP